MENIQNELMEYVKCEFQRNRVEIQKIEIEFRKIWNTDEEELSDRRTEINEIESVLSTQLKELYGKQSVLLHLMSKFGDNSLITCSNETSGIGGDCYYHINGYQIEHLHHVRTV